MIEVLVTFGNCHAICGRRVNLLTGLHEKEGKLWPLRGDSKLIQEKSLFSAEVRSVLNRALWYVLRCRTNAVTGTESVVFEASNDVKRACSRWNDAAAVRVEEHPLLTSVLVDEPIERPTPWSPRLLARPERYWCSHIIKDDSKRLRVYPVIDFIVSMSGWGDRGQRMRPKCGSELLT